MAQPILTIWVIYHGATNHPPGKWVLRAQDGRIQPRDVCHECDTLTEARSHVPPGLICMHRMNDDDPSIVEVWF